jgi:beta-galactosidase
MNRSIRVLFWVGLLVIGGFASASARAGEGRSEVDLSGAGWKLWRDAAASWEGDELFLPPVDTSKLPSNPPTGGWAVLDSQEAKAVSVPGTAEEYLQHGEGPGGDITGVTWWYRTIHIPEGTSPRRILLRFESTRLRAEIYLNHQLIGYDIIGNTPFEADASKIARPGEDCQLAVRITDAGGNFDWHDGSGFMWGKYKIPSSHGFGGITGRVKLIECDPIYIDDLHVQNTPAITTVNALLTIQNTTDQEVHRDVVVSVCDRNNPSTEIARQELKDQTFKPGENHLTLKLDGKDAKIWDLENPNLYVCRAELEDKGEVKDWDEKTMGFRWFGEEGVGQDAMFRLNGKRIVLRTAISWGFWPITGIFPTPELAEKEIRAAKTFGLNMLNFHRTIGHPISMEKADELGLLIFEEPGGYVSGDGDAFAQAVCREKLLRMVKRDRNHPSVIIYNMINEGWDSGGARMDKTILDHHVQDMTDAHAIDPSRTIVHTSAWASGPDVDEPPKMHMRPFDSEVHMHGWFDFHRAGGPETWQQSLYRDPGKFYARSENVKEIVYDGEEGAISTPPRLQEIKAALDASPQLGWDGAVYLDWYKKFNDFLDRKNLRSAFPTLESFTVSMGNVSMYHQGRKIENVRICNANDGYAVNGWEAEIIENHSGIVDCFRNPKGDPNLIAKYNQPLFVAVKPRDQIVQMPGEVVVDFYLVNEKDVKGEYSLKVSAKNSAGETVLAKTIPVSVTGGDVYGQLLSEAVRIPVFGATGFFHIEANLLDAFGKTIAFGDDQIFAVDWKSDKIAGNGAIWEAGQRIGRFLKEQKQLEPAKYSDNLGKLDYVVVARPPNEGDGVEISEQQWVDLGDKKGGVRTTILNGRDFDQQLAQRTDKTMNFSVEEGALPDPAAGVVENYDVHFEGQILPPVSGTYTFVVKSTNGVRLRIAGNEAFDTLKSKGNQLKRVRVDLEAGKAVPVDLEFRKLRGGARCQLLWAIPEVSPPDPQKLIDRVRDDGTTLVILDRTDTWMDLIKKNTQIEYGGTFTVGRTWLGGEQFVKSHPLFKDLPVNCAMDWPYQAVVRDGNGRYGLLLEGEELVAGAYHCYPMALGTAVGIIPCGKGKIIVSTLDICDNLNSKEAPAGVARKMLCNFLEFAGAK